MSQEQTNGARSMPKLVEFFLTKRVPCAALVLMMLTSAYWLNFVFGQIPLLGFVFMLVGMLLHLAVPGVFALVLFGGGLKYGLQVGGIAALAILLLSSGSVYAVLIFLVLFVVVPLMTALLMQYQGLGRSSWSLAMAIFTIVIVALMVSMGSNGLQGFVSQMFKPVFDSVVTGLPLGEADAVHSMRQLQEMMVKIFPGLLAFGLWLSWWSNILYARKVAKKYGFYQGDDSEVLQLRLPKQLVYVLLLLTLVANIASGDLQYIAINGILVLAGLLSVQGIAVGHVWLKSRGMMNTVIVMYVMLFVWSVVVVAFTIIGLLDIWFNFRRNIIPTTGEK